LGLNKSGTKADGQWMVHHDDFAQLLAQLNEKKKQQKKEAPLEEADAEGQMDVTADTPSASASIEERSRHSRTRIQ
jgi:glycerophosphoryl diester phosphodiesterase